MIHDSQMIQILFMLPGTTKTEKGSAAEMAVHDRVFEMMHSDLKSPPVSHNTRLI